MSQNFMNSIWMGDLEDYMDEAFIKRAFELANESVGAVKVIRNKTSQQSLGYCFVDFPIHINARDTMLRLNGKVIPGSNPPKRFKLNNASYGRDIPGAAEFSLFVGELSEDVDDLALFRAFSRYATCKSAKVVTDGGRSRGYGFVRFASELDQKRALQEMQNFIGLGYRALRVSLATPKRQDEAGATSLLGSATAPYGSTLMGVPDPSAGINDSLAMAVAAAVSGNSTKQAEYYQQMYQQYYHQQSYYAATVGGHMPPMYGAPPHLQPPNPYSANPHAQTPYSTSLSITAPVTSVQSTAQAPTSPTKATKQTINCTLEEPSDYWKRVEKELLSTPDVFQEMEMSKWDFFDESEKAVVQTY